MKFRVEHIMRKRRPVLIFARQLEAGSFELSASPKLGEVSIRRHLSMPRTVEPDGKVNSSLFAFYLSAASDLNAIAVGDELELT